eukprot:6202991-Pleurochrysis_carterae.AAC.1
MEQIAGILLLKRVHELNPLEMSRMIDVGRVERSPDERRKTAHAAAENGACCSGKAAHGRATRLCSKPTRCVKTGRIIVCRRREERHQSVFSYLERPCGCSEGVVERPRSFGIRSGIKRFSTCCRDKRTRED